MTKGNKIQRNLLLILDGWGYSVAKKNNAIYLGNTPNWNKMWSNNPKSLLKASGEAVGLPLGQMGNSEVGHIHISAGRRIPQQLLNINLNLDSNLTLHNTLKNIQQRNGRLHLMGLLSDGGVHSHMNHCLTIIRKAKEIGIAQCFVHAFLDGRDVPPRSAVQLLSTFEKQLQSIGYGELSSISGRFYAMDRDNRWDRIALCYEMLTNKANEPKPSWDTLLNQAYKQGNSDEFIKPVNLTQTVIENNDSILHFNFRADRARQLAQAFTQEKFSGFVRKNIPENVEFICMTDYPNVNNNTILFPTKIIENTLGKVWAKLKEPQLRIAETEKYAHVTYFFNGGEEQPLEFEHRIMIPSPKVLKYETTPEMSIEPLMAKLCTQLNNTTFSLLICNFANADMLGHTGNLNAAIQSVEAIDKALGQTAMLCSANNINLWITADHGNVESMWNENNKSAHTAHTSNPVPFIYIGNSNVTLKKTGELSNIAPTILKLNHLPIPSEMNESILV
jgi:2,3-bisphosphoglycerate-independent phosphoglycerate mutase